MLHNIPEPVSRRMRQLEQMDAQDRADGTTRLKRLRQIEPDVGKFIGILAATAPPGAWLEIGTSGGYSSLWLALAARATGRKLTTYEILEEKAELARATFELAGVGDVVEFVHGDALQYFQDWNNVGFCFLDAEKEVYEQCYEAVLPKLVPGGILVADNAISHASSLASMVNRALHDQRVDALIVPIGKGELVCRRVR